MLYSPKTGEPLFENYYTFQNDTFSFTTNTRVGHLYKSYVCFPPWHRGLDSWPCRTSEPACKCYLTACYVPFRNLNYLLQRDGVTASRNIPRNFMSGYTYAPIRLDITYVPYLTALREANRFLDCLSSRSHTSQPKSWCRAANGQKQLARKLFNDVRTVPNGDCGPGPSS